MSLFGKKEGSSSKPMAPALNVPANPPVPPLGSPVAESPGGRKRITQRLVLGGKGADSEAIHVGGGAKGLKLPGAPDPVTSQSLPMAHYTGTVDVPVANLLGSVPAEFVVSDHDTLYQSPLAQETVKLPLNVVLPLLPSGKIEILAQDLFTYMPEGVMKSGPELGEYAMSPVSLPLPEVISRIPEAALTLRSDQKPIDTTVAGMDDPFSAEMLAAAQEEAMRAQQEAENAAAETQQDPVADAGEAQATETIPGFASPPAEAAAPELAPAPVEPEPEPVPAPPATPPTPETPEQEVDLSFAKSPEYQEMLQKLEAEAAQEQAPATEAAPAEEFTAPLPAESTSPIPSEEDLSGTEVTKIIPKVPVADTTAESGFAVAAGDTATENPLIAPTRVMREEQEPATAPPPSFQFPAAAPAQAPAESPELSAFNSPPAAEPPAPAGEAAYRVSGKLAQLLGIRGPEIPTLKDIVHQVNAWPGMKGCIVGGKDGLRISSEVEDDDFANSISAFAPKLIATISELFNDLGFEDVEEMHTPVRDSSVYIFRKQDLYMIVLFEDTSFPESYRTRIRQVMAEIGSAKQ